MINFEAIQDQQDFVTQRFRSASIRIRRAFTPPPRRGSDHSDHFDEDSQVQMPIQLPDVGQDVRNVLERNVSPTRSWWSFIASVMSLMHFIPQCYQFVNGMVTKAKQITVVYVNVNQVRTIIRTIIDQRRQQVQRRSQSYSSHLDQYLCAFVLFSILFATRVSLFFISCHSIHPYLNHLV